MAEPRTETEKLRGLLWYAWSEMNAIRAESGVPRGYDGHPKAINEDYWSGLVDAMQAALGKDAQPWPSEAAKQAFSFLPQTGEGAGTGHVNVEPVSAEEAERQAQRISFAFGNVALSNPNVTRETVEEAARQNPAPMSPGEQGDAWTRGAATALHALIAGFREFDLAQNVAREIHLSADDIGSCGLEPGTAARVIDALSKREDRTP